MTPQLRLTDAPETAKTRRRTSSGGRDRDRMDKLGGVLLYWAPAWLPALVLLQIVCLGLGPAIEERDRLQRAEAQVSRWEQELAESTEIAERGRRMLADEIYRERVRKSVGIPGTRPLLLEDTAVRR